MLPSVHTLSLLRSLLNPRKNDSQDAVNFAFDVLERRLIADGIPIKNARLLVAGAVLIGVGFMAWGVSIALGYPLPNVFTFVIILALGYLVLKMEPFLHYGLAYSALRRTLLPAVLCTGLFLGSRFGFIVQFAAICTFGIGFFYAVINLRALQDEGYLKRSSIAMAAQRTLSTSDFDRCVVGLGTLVRVIHLVLTTRAMPNKAPEAILTKALANFGIKSDHSQPQFSSTNENYPYLDDQTVKTHLERLAYSA